jgi:hypothetical protein
MIKNIATGWFNQIRDSMGILPEDIKLLAEKRLKNCDTCPQRKENSCSVCGCALKAKTKDPKSSCPLNRW